MVIQNGIPLKVFVPTEGDFYSISNVGTSPSSRGSVSLNSSNPFAPPIIDPALLATEYDRAIMREAVRSSQRFASAPALSGYIVGPVPPLASATTDAELDAYISAGATTLFHPCGTAKMSARSASYGVVDPDLKVKKVSGLRVVDASVFVRMFCYLFIEWFY